MKKIKRKKRTTGSFMLRNLPDAEHRFLKIEAVKSQVTMEHKLIEWIREKMQASHEQTSSH